MTEQKSSGVLVYMYQQWIQIMFPVLIYCVSYLIFDFILEFIGANLFLPGTIVNGLCMLGAALSIMGAFQVKDLSLRINPLLLIVIPLGICYTVFFNCLLAYIPIKGLSESYAQAEGVLYAVPFWQQLILYGIISPIAEELVFRGALYRRMRKLYAVLPCALCSGFLFGLYHGNIVQGLYGFVMGLLMSLVYEMTDSFLAPLLFHAAANIVSCTATYANDFGRIVFSLPGMIIGFVMGTVLLTIMILYVKKVKKRSEGVTQ